MLMASAGLSFVTPARCHVLHIFRHKLTRNERPQEEKYQNWLYYQFKKAGWSWFPSFAYVTKSAYIAVRCCACAIQRPGWLSRYSDSLSARGEIFRVVQFLASSTLGIGSSPWVKRPRRAAERSPSYSAEICEWVGTVPPPAFDACVVTSLGDLYLYVRNTCVIMISTKWEGYRGHGGAAPGIVYSGTSWMRKVWFTFQLSYP